MIVAVVAVIALLLIPSVTQSRYYVNLAVQCMIWALFAMSLDLLVGYLGHASFGHAAFLGVAGYAVAILNVTFKWDPLAAAGGALVAAFVLAMIFGAVVSHVTGIYYTIVNFALAQTMWGLAYQWYSLTGGDNGVRGVARPSIFGIASGGTNAFFYFVAVIFVVCTLLLLLVVSSPFGLTMRGIKQTQSRMRVLGYNVWLHKYIAYVIAGTFAGVAGIMQSYFDQFIGPGQVSMMTSAKVVLMVIVGGAGTLLGPLFGGVLVVIIQNAVSAFTDRWMMVLGVMYVIIVVFVPGGLMGLYRRIARRSAGPARIPVAASGPADGGVVGSPV